MTKKDFIKPEHLDYIDPVTFYNLYKTDHAITIFNSCHRKSGKSNSLFIEDGKTKCGNVIIKDNLFYIKDNERLIKIPHNTTLTPFQVYCILEHNKNFASAIMAIETQFMNRLNPYCRVGIDYFKVIKKPDRFNIPRTELKRWNKDALITDYGKDFVKNIRKFDDFTIEPDNVNYNPVITAGNFIFRNLYNPFEHKPIEGDFPWSKVLMNHIFGDQIELGYKYMQCLFLHPKQILPILVLVSEERGTGKTTFINWLNQIFGANMMQINPEDITNSFNGTYSRSNIIAIEEAFFEKDAIIEKLKSITTAKYMSVNQKHIDHYKIPFFGKVIIASNKVENFARIDDMEIRFWIRQLKSITTENARIEDDLAKEIPAFLYYLQSLPKLDRTLSRMVFTADEISNENLTMVKDESKPGLYKEMIINIQEHFTEHDNSEIKMTLSDIKNIWFEKYHNYSKSYIRLILKKHFKMECPNQEWYTPLNQVNQKNGRVYIFLRDDYMDINTDTIHVSNSDNELPF